MSADDFVAMIEELLAAQAAYFRSGGDAAALRKAKHHAALVRGVIKSHRRGERPIQGELWGREKGAYGCP